MKSSLTTQAIDSALASYVSNVGDQRGDIDTESTVLAAQIRSPAF